jgi:peptidoglycan/xylan/chitin deacetylase (PgdA/CDA1 family)
MVFAVPQGSKRMLIKTLKTILLLGGVGKQLSILIYHRVLPKPDTLRPGIIDVALFDVQMQALTEYFYVLPLEEAVNRLIAGNLPSMAACVTFDDGYADNAVHALPVLMRYKIPTTFFIATGFIDGGRMWNDTIIEFVRNTTDDTLDLTQLELGVHLVQTIEQKKKAIRGIIARLKYLPVQEKEEKVLAIAELSETPLPTDLMMTSEQIHGIMAGGMTVGAHTVHHPILSTLDINTAQEEIMQNKEQLEYISGSPVRIFAYPNGKPGKDYTYEHIGLIRKCGFNAAVSTARGVATNNTDIFQLPRFTPWDRTHRLFATRLLFNYINTNSGQVSG